MQRVPYSVNPDFVDPCPVKRETIEAVWQKKLTLNQLQVEGFLNWAEMRQMEADRVMDIQSHTMTHTWYFNGPDIIGFHRPGSNVHPWLAWNERSDREICLYDRRSVLA